MKMQLAEFSINAAWASDKIAQAYHFFYDRCMSKKITAIYQHRISTKFKVQLARIVITYFEPIAFGKIILCLCRISMPEVQQMQTQEITLIDSVWIVELVLPTILQKLKMQCNLSTLFPTKVLFKVEIVALS